MEFEKCITILSKRGDLAENVDGIAVDDKKVCQGCCNSEHFSILKGRASTAESSNKETESFNSFSSLELVNICTTLQGERVQVDQRHNICSLFN